MGRIRNLSALPYAYLQTVYSGLISARMVEKSPRVVCQALTLRQTEHGQEILLSLRSDVRGWELPGGRIEPGEQASDALIREMREETGLRVEVGRHVGDYVRTGFRPHVARVYACQVLSGRETSSSETLAVSWFPIGELPRELLPWYRQPIEDGLSESAHSQERAEYQGIDAIWSAVKIDLRMRWRER
ncbi:MAG: NUDIX domain-containing protein [Myxococcota bacterium]|nr:NUDIX domain-containing protein [Myxococcota bacterium]